MSILLVRGFSKFRIQSHQINSILRLTSRSLGISSITLQNEKIRSDNAITTSNASNKTNVSTDVRPLGERIKENTKTASYFGVILFGIGVTGVIIFIVFKELFSSSSANNIYSDALSVCVNDTRVQDALGYPIKGYGEETRRRRRQHVAHTIYERNGKQYIRMQFYIQGIRNKATVHLEKELISNRYRYLFVQLDYYPRETIILEDNRLSIDGAAATQSLDSL